MARRQAHAIERGRRVVLAGHAVRPLSVTWLSGSRTCASRPAGGSGTRILPQPTGCSPIRDTCRAAGRGPRQSAPSPHRVRNSPADGQSPPFPLNNKPQVTPSIGECPMIANHRSTTPGVQADSSVVRSCPGSHGQHGDRALAHPASGAGTGLGEVGTCRATAFPRERAGLLAPWTTAEPGRWLNRDLAVGTAGQGRFRLPG